MTGGKDEHLFQRIANEIERGILSGKYGARAPIPSIRALAAQHAVAPMTVHRAVRHLVAAGRLRSVSGVGVFPSDGRPLDAIALVTDEACLTHYDTPDGRRLGMFLDVLAGAKRACTEAGLHLVTVTEHDDPARLLNGRTGFLLHFGDYRLSPLMRWVTAILLAKAPHVAISYDYGLRNFVDRDVRGAYEKGLRHLYEQGHRRVLLLPRTVAGKAPDLDPWPPPGLESMDIRVHIVPGWPEATCEAAVARLVPEHLARDARDRATAVVIGPGNMAVPALSALERAGLSVPGDCSLLGFCGALQAQAAGRTVTHLDYAWPAIAARAVNELLAMAATRRDIGHVRVTPDLVPGDTCGPAPRPREANLAWAR